MSFPEQAGQLLGEADVSVVRMQRFYTSMSYQSQLMGSPSTHVHVPWAGSAFQPAAELSLSMRLAEQKANLIFPSSSLHSSREQG